MIHVVHILVLLTVRSETWITWCYTQLFLGEHLLGCNSALFGFPRKPNIVVEWQTFEGIIFVLNKGIYEGCFPGKFLFYFFFYFFFFFCTLTIPQGPWNLPKGTCWRSWVQQQVHHVSPFSSGVKIMSSIILPRKAAKREFFSLLNNIEVRQITTLDRLAHFLLSCGGYYYYYYVIKLS